MRSPFADWLEAYIGDVRRLHLENGRVLRRAAHAKPAGARGRYLDLIEASRWASVVAQARRDLRLALRQLGQLRGAQQSHAVAVRALSNVLVASDLIVAPSDQPEFRRRTQYLREAWRAEGRESSEISSMLKTLRELDPTDTGAQIVGAVRQSEAVMDDTRTV